MIYHVWNQEWQYTRSIEATSVEEAIQVAKAIGIPYPIVQDQESLAAQYYLKPTDDIAKLARTIKLRFADIKSAEQRNWRDRSYGNEQ